MLISNTLVLSIKFFDDDVLDDWLAASFADELTGVMVDVVWLLGDD